MGVDGTTASYRPHALTLWSLPPRPSSLVSSSRTRYAMSTLQRARGWRARFLAPRSQCLGVWQRASLNTLFAVPSFHTSETDSRHVLRRAEDDIPAGRSRRYCFPSCLSPTTTFASCYPTAVDPRVYTLSFRSCPCLAASCHSLSWYLELSYSLLTISLEDSSLHYWPTRHREPAPVGP